MDRQQVVNRQTFLSLARCAGNRRLVDRLDPPAKIWIDGAWRLDQGAGKLVWDPRPGHGDARGPASPAAPAGGEEN